MPERIELSENKTKLQNEGQSEDVKLNVSKACDLYVVGKLWVDVLQSGLLGAQSKIIPVVEAAQPQPPPPPQKPPPMRFKDLPLCESPHYEYKTYLEDLEQCPKAKTRLIHELLLPHVSSFRKSVEQGCCELSCDLGDVKNEMKCSINSNMNKFKSYMRDPENQTLRRVVESLGGLAGYYIGYYTGGGIPRRLLFTGLGLLGTGALCFPKETDEKFRDFTYNTAKVAIALYNKYCGKSFGLREKLNCKDESPPQ